MLAGEFLHVSFGRGSRGGELGIGNPFKTLRVNFRLELRPNETHLYFGHVSFLLTNDQ